MIATASAVVRVTPVRSALGGDAAFAEPRRMRAPDARRRHDERRRRP